ncbi:integrase catalytic domain-containing protein [Trichonephila clavata]|uniref:Integrase catalytic domain-containing protein n=1 Tax=Trichonephila clavata TaxID=2740835 RepID=A0A8X6FHC8_TRICU|nr:integrase catalytic domain-containing protein [Trichonephila clavata]
MYRNDENIWRGLFPLAISFGLAKVVDDVFRKYLNRIGSLPTSDSIHYAPSPNVTVKLPTVNINTFYGEIEEFHSFWERFENCIDKNESLSQIDKHVFLRGYLDAEAKRLVDGISITADTYTMTKEILKSKYGNKDKIIQAHLDYLENLTPIKDLSPSALNELYIDCNRRLQALDALGEKTQSYGRILAPKILRAFPHEICRNWVVYAKSENLAERDITKLMKFLSEDVEETITANNIKGSLVPSCPIKSSLENFKVHSRPISKDRKISPLCPFCETSEHWPQQCNSVTDIEARIQKLKATNRCFLCTNRGHVQKNCFHKEKYCCSKCRKKHHVSICKTPTNEQFATTSTNKIDTSTYNFVHLQRARVFITGSNGITKLTRCLLDGGSQSSFISSDLVNTLNLPVISTGPLDLQAFESPTSFSHKRRQVQFQLSSIWDKSKVNVIAFESSNRYASHPSSPTEVLRFAKSKRMKLADPDDSLSSLPIEILIGADFYWNAMHSDAPVKLSDSLALVPSSFGWILSGSRSHAAVSFNPIVHSINVDTLTHDLDNMVRNFWNLESIGIQPIQEKLRLSTHNAELLTDFHQSFKIIDGRRVVNLPWKPEVKLTSSNYDTAIHRFNSWTRRYTQYRVETKITNEGIKWRIVFDASSHSPGHPSLNDAFEAGPNLLPDILAMLLGFRLSKTAVTSDGSQTFLQLILADEDRDATQYAQNGITWRFIAPRAGAMKYLLGWWERLIGLTQGLIKSTSSSRTYSTVFGKKWSKEYLLQLRSFHQVRNKDSTINIRVGDIVLLQEDIRPRHMWKKARVMNLHQGRDGKIRSCELRVNGRNVTRPVQLVIPLEIDQGGEDVGNEIKCKV